MRGESDHATSHATAGAEGSLLEKDVERFWSEATGFKDEQVTRDFSESVAFSKNEGEADYRGPQSRAAFARDGRGLRAEPTASGAEGSLLERDVERFGAKRQFLKI